MRYLFSLSQVFLALLGISSGARAHEVPALKEVFAGTWQMGVALNEEVVRNGGAAMHALASRHFDTVTPENELKWSVVHPAEGQFNFAPADVIADFVRKYGMSMTGHAFIWHTMAVDWVFEDADGAPASRECVLARLRTHMGALIERYGEVVTGWDVVNEAVSEETGEYLRDTQWRRALGDDYVADVFKMAAELAPGAKLYYNDYNLAKPEKREKTVRLVSDLLDRGIRVDAVGMQCHGDLGYPTAESVASSIEAFAALGVRVHISEMDLSLYAFDDHEDRFRTGAPRGVLKEQADRYAALFRVFLAHRDIIDRVAFWGLHDGQSWRNYTPVSDRPDYPLLFDAEGRPKPAFHAVVRAGRKELP
ncbi:MAG: endo-1,4-beta-xylanase [Candidatus Hydrogenedentota bacterium]